MKASVRRALWFALFSAAFAGCYVGWRNFWFLTDDAFIAFRYAHNEIVGRGLVWNPAPFRPVEGYTSFLWVVLLDLVWRVTGRPPPETANWLSLALGLATLWIGLRMLLRVRLPERVEAVRPLLVALAALGIVSNRTFLAWLSSGLETALFNFWLTLWLSLTLLPGSARRRSWLLWLALVASAITLTRPDGLLYTAATVLIVTERVRRTGRPTELAWAAPLLLVPAHLLWRFATYGAWLPNTYYAKHLAAWPESGLRYFACFALEYGVWLWFLLLLAWAVKRLRSGPAGALRAAWRERYAALVSIATVVAHLAYYTLIVGGDHFEYRVYSYVVLLLFASAAVLAAHLAPGRLGAPLLVALLVAVSWPIPWIHWDETRHLVTRPETFRLARPIAPRFPAPLRPVIERWDAWQEWLILRFVGMRHQEHKIFYKHQVGTHPSRAVGSRIRWSERAVIPMKTVGVTGWVLPNVAIIDQHGLNDYVIARTPPPATPRRRMAHERLPPKGYLTCFKPNAEILYGTVKLLYRRPLSDEEIRACDRRFAPD